MAGFETFTTAPSTEQGVTVVTFDGATGDPYAIQAGCMPGYFYTHKVTAGRQIWQAQMGLDYGLLQADGTFTVLTSTPVIVRPIDSLKELLAGDTTDEHGAHAGFMLTTAFKDTDSQLVCWR